MIAQERFIVRSSDCEAWLAARAEGVTATQVAKAATPAGMREALQEISEPSEVFANEFMLWGTEREPAIALTVQQQHGIEPNDWLIAADGRANRWMLATPDGLSTDHTVIGEYKTGGKPFTRVPIAHRRQVQWQLFVTGAERCLYAFEQRLGEPGAFYPAFDIHTEWIERDEQEISKLRAVAEQLQEHAVFLSRSA